MRKLTLAATVLAASLGSISSATAERSIFDVFQPLYGETQLERSEACIGKPLGQSHRSCGAYADGSADAKRPAWRTLN